MSDVQLIGHSVTMALYAAVGMFWQIFWALVLGFAISGIITAFVSKHRIAGALGRFGAKEIARALWFGALSSSCSFAAAAMSRRLFQKGAHLVPALAFLLASTNLVLELSAVLWILMGWQFVLAELIGGVVLIAIMALLMKVFAPLELFAEKQRELAKAAESPGSGADADPVADPRTLAGWREVARAFVSEWRMIWADIALGMVVSGFLMEVVPGTFWRALFWEGGRGSLLENALVGPLVSVLSFVCSIGNIPLAAVLYRGGITFGGAVSFIFADLIIIPLILVYRRYYGWRIALWITGVFYAAMVLAGILVELVFGGLHLIPERRTIPALAETRFFQVDHTFWLNLVFLGVSLALVWLARSGPADAPGTESPCCHEE